MFDCAALKLTFRTEYVSSEENSERNGTQWSNKNKDIRRFHWNSEACISRFSVSLFYQKQPSR